MYKCELWSQKHIHCIGANKKTDCPHGNNLLYAVKSNF